MDMTVTGSSEVGIDDAQDVLKYETDHTGRHSAQWAAPSIEAHLRLPVVNSTKSSAWTNRWTVSMYADAKVMPF